MIILFHVACFKMTGSTQDSPAAPSDFFKLLLSSNVPKLNQWLEKCLLAFTDEQIIDKSGLLSNTVFY